MYPIPGHLALSLAGTTVLRLPAVPAIAATFAVDIADKFLKDVFAIAPSGRCWFHTLLSVFVLSAIVWRVKGKAWGKSWFVGHLSHLIGDIGFVPWLYPFISYEWPETKNMVAITSSFLNELVMGAMNGWQFSGAVSQVFLPRLFLIEGAMLASILAYRHVCGIRPKSAMLLTVFMTLFLLSTSLGLLCQFPDAVDWAARHFGEWVRAKPGQL